VTPPECTPGGIKARRFLLMQQKGWIYVSVHFVIIVMETRKNDTILVFVLRFDVGTHLPGRVRHESVWQMASTGRAVPNEPDGYVGKWLPDCGAEGATTVPVDGLRLATR
jgi:hypothetical protein